MAPLLDDATLVHNYDAVRIADGRQPVRDDEAGPALPEPRHRVLDQDLGSGVNAARSLVEDQHGRIGEEGARDREQLFLAGGDIGGIIGQDGLVPVGSVRTNGST